MLLNAAKIISVSILLSYWRKLVQTSKEIYIFHACNNLLCKITHFNTGIWNLACTVACSNYNLFTLVNI